MITPTMPSLVRPIARRTVLAGLKAAALAPLPLAREPLGAVPVAAKKRKKSKKVRKTFRKRGRILLNELGPSSAWPSSIRVKGFKRGKVKDVSVTLHNISHQGLNHLDVMLVGPGNRKTKLLSDVGGDIGPGSVTNLTLTFVKNGPGPLSADVPPVSGKVRPTNNDSAAEGTTERFFSDPGGPGETTNTDLSIYKGIDPNGTWRLFISDDSSSFDGFPGEIADGWSLQITAKVKGKRK